MNTSERILSVAKEMFFRYGVKSITLDEIVKQLGISKKTFYKEFEDKNSMLITFCKQHALENQAEITGIVSSTNNAIEEIMQLMAFMGRKFAQINPVFFYDLQRFYPGAWEVFKEFKEKFILAIVEKNLKQGIKEGNFRNEINVKALAKLRIEEVDMAFNPAIFSPEEFNLQELQFQFLDHFIRGIVTEKGALLIKKYNKTVSL